MDRRCRPAFRAQAASSAVPRLRLAASCLGEPLYRHKQLGRSPAFCCWPHAPGSDAPPGAPLGLLVAIGRLLLGATTPEGGSSTSCVQCRTQQNLQLDDEKPAPEGAGFLLNAAIYRANAPSQSDRQCTGLPTDRTLSTRTFGTSPPGRGSSPLNCLERPVGGRHPHPLHAR